MGGNPCGDLRAYPESESILERAVAGRIEIKERSIGNIIVTDDEMRRALIWLNCICPMTGRLPLSGRRARQWAIIAAILSMPMGILEV